MLPKIEYQSVCMCNVFDAFVRCSSCKWSYNRFQYEKPWSSPSIILHANHSVKTTMEASRTILRKPSSIKPSNHPITVCYLVYNIITIIAVSKAPCIIKKKNYTKAIELHVIIIFCLFVSLYQAPTNKCEIIYLI